MPPYNIANPKNLQANIASRILVVDHNPIISFAIKKLLVHYPYINVAGQCHDEYEITATYKKLSPDIIIIDPMLSMANPTDIFQLVKQYSDKAKFIIYSNKNNILCASRYIDSGVKGIILKQSGVNDLLSGILSVSRGFTFMDKTLIPYASSQESMDNINAQPDTLTLPRISPREKQILSLITQGLKNKEIAEKLVISTKTVESHRLNLMKKLDAHSVVDLIKWAKHLNIQ